MVSILGCGPAGASAAIAARREGAAVKVIEKSKLPRHKVCGEFLSPEIGPELERLGVWDAFMAARPAKVRQMKLHFGSREKICPLPEPAWGLSRFAFDALLANQAAEVGAEFAGDLVGNQPDGPVVVASGRRVPSSKRGQRLFGFKAHFEGPVDDAVELFFFDRCYVGVNAVEAGRTNVCGLGPEDVLNQVDFDFDALVNRSSALAGRLRPLGRSMKWLSTGPLQYRQTFSSSEHYLAGDALSFVDPFTGSGLVSAVKIGALAGTAAARRTSIEAYTKECRTILKSPFEVASIFRHTIRRGWAERLVGLVPGRILFSLTRPNK